MTSLNFYAKYVSLVLRRDRLSQMWNKKGRDTGTAHCRRINISISAFGLTPYLGLTSGWKVIPGILLLLEWSVTLLLGLIFVLLSLPSFAEWPERPNPALERRGGGGEGTALSPDSTGGCWGTGVADKGQKGSGRKAQWWIWQRQKCYPGMQVGSAGVHSPDNEAPCACRACSHLPHDVRVLLCPPSLPSIPIPRHGFWGRPDCCSSSGSLSPAPHDVQTTFLPADSSPREILLLQRALVPAIFK